MITAPPHPVVLEGLVHLAQFLITQADIVENPEEEDKKRSFVHGKIPQEMVKDPSGLARELLWRAKRELGQEMTFSTEHIVSVSEGQSNGTDIKPKIENGSKGRNVKKMKLAASRSRTSAFSPL
jgi:F-box/leucine-rich repeat protein 10/11